MGAEQHLGAERLLLDLEIDPTTPYVARLLRQLEVDRDALRRAPAEVDEDLAHDSPRMSAKEILAANRRAREALPDASEDEIRRAVEAALSAGDALPESERERGTGQRRASNG